MGQHYQPDFDKMIQGQSIVTTDDEILADIRSVMMADKVEHPEVVQQAQRKPRVQKQAVKQAVAKTVSPAVQVARQAKGYQPRWSHNLLILLLAALIYSPLGVISIIASVIAAVWAVCWLVGTERLSVAGRAIFGVFYRVFPAQADRIVAWANRLSDRLQALVNRMPSRWTQGLYFPSFTSEPEVEMDHVEPFDRLLQQRRGGV